MSSNSAPNYYFSGINFNSSYFVSSSSGLTIGQLNNYYLSKKNTDTATSAITFNSGLNSSLVNSPSGVLDLTATNIYLNSTRSNLGRVGNTFLEINNGGTNAMYLDFHSSNTSSDYDTRIQSSGGSSTSGQGNLELTALGINLNTTSSVGTNYIIKNGSIGIETGINTNVAYVDFHSSSSTSSDYDSRITASGGTTTSGQGNLDLIAQGINLNTTIFNGKNYVVKYGSIGVEAGVAPNYAFIDFHSSNASSGFDSRIYSSGGTTTSGQGDLELIASNIKFTGNLIFNNGISVPNGDISTSNNINASEFQPFYSTDSINLFTTGSGLITLGNSSGALNLNTPICPQALTFNNPYQVGWSEKVTYFVDTAYIGPGGGYTKTSQSLTSGVMLPKGTYLITMTASTTIVGTLIGGTTTQAGAGYFLNNTSYGSTSGVVIVVNTTQSTHPLLARTPGQYYWNYSLVVKNTLADAFIYGHVFWASSAAITSGTVQNIIHSYSLTRIA